MVEMNLPNSLCLPVTEQWLPLLQTYTATHGSCRSTSTAAFDIALRCQTSLNASIGSDAFDSTYQTHETTDGLQSTKNCEVHPNQLHQTEHHAFTTCSPRVPLRVSHVFPRVYHVFTTCLPRVHHVFTTCSPACFPRVSHVFPRVYHVFTTCSPRVYHVFTTCLPRVYHVPTTCLPRVYHVFTTCSPRVYHVFTTCSPRVHHVFTTCRTWFGEPSNREG